MIGAVATLGVGALAVAASTLGVPVSVVTAFLGISAMANFAPFALDLSNGMRTGNWDQIAYDVGALAGGTGAGSATGRFVAENVNGVPSGAFKFNDAFQNFRAELGNLNQWLGTGPNVGSAAGSTAASGAGLSLLSESCGC